VGIEEYKIVYNYANEFLLTIVKENKEKFYEAPELVIQKYFFPDKTNGDLSKIYHRLLRSIANRNMLPRVIGFEKPENQEKFKRILFNYDYKKIIEAYPAAEELFSIFKKEFRISNPDNNRNLWKKFSEGILSGANFLVGFKDKDDFNEFVNKFSYNKYTKAALPMLLGKEIEGVGFALACDFLKEIGYEDYPKPDVHLIDVFYELGLSKTKNPYEVYKKIIEMSEAVNESAYKVDKIFWLICGGTFYNHKVKIGQNKDKFIKQVKTKLI
jgi:hypothetical protein